MVATLRLTSHHTNVNVDDGSTTDAVGTTIYFKAAADSDASGGGVAHSAGGTNYSYIKQFRWYVNAAPIHSVSNLKFYMTGTPIANIDIKAKISLTWTDALIQTTTALTGVTSMYTYTASAPVSLDGTFVVGTDTAPKFIGGFLQLQLAVGNAAVNNVVLGNLIGRYDEA